MALDETEGSATAWIELHQAVWTHRKSFELGALLGIDETYAAAHVIRLWSWALDNAPSGNLSALSDRAVAFGAGWRHEAGLFVRALTEAGWLDHERTIHDWDEYAGKLIERRNEDKLRKRVARASGGQAPDVHGMSNGTASGFRRTVPNTTGPDTTGPDSTSTLHPNPPPQAAEGRFPDDVVARLEQLPTTLDADAFHTAVAAGLTALGFDCQVEVRVPNRGDGHAGRLDLVAERRGVLIAFELDDRTPRRKSLTKLAGATGCHFRAVVLRCPADGPLPDAGRDITVLGAGRSHAPAEGERLAPVTKADRKLWDQALGHLPPMNDANREQISRLTPLGRASDGGLRLRAPPGLGAARYRGHVARALADAGDPAAQHVAIVEG